VSDALIQSFWVNIIAGVVLLVFPPFLKWSHARLTGGRPTSRITNLTTAGLCWLILNIAYLLIWPKYAALVVLLSAVAMAWVAHSELNQFWRIGLVAADAQISSGLDFSHSLQLATNSLDFLGIGASKLSGETKDFEAAVQRCQRADRPVRFLLCRPDNEKLPGMAQSAGRDPAEYQKRVRTSLQAIAEMRNSRRWNIEVRFYEDFPIFRLMFINDEICLASHYVFGKGTGSESPQLHVVRPSASRDVDSLYYAFHSYFERFWSEAISWDFREYLENK
jgi:hypothetical protein